MENITLDYPLFTEKDIEDKRIVLLTDLHDYKYIETLSNAIGDIKPDLILISGDIMKGSKYADQSQFADLQRSLLILSLISPVVLEPGNHDLQNEPNNWEIQYRSLDKVAPGRIFPLINDNVKLGDIRVVGFCPSRDVFVPSIQEHGGALEHVISGWEEHGQWLSSGDKSFNLLLTHNPFNFQQAINLSSAVRFGYSKELTERAAAVSEKMKAFDMVASGHLHGGYIPADWYVKNPERFLDKGVWEMAVEKDKDGKIKFFRPWIYKATDLCRGVVYVGQDDRQILQLSNGKYFVKDNGNYTEVDSELAMKMTETKTPIVISGGVNPLFGLPVVSSEITQIDVKKK